jgi:hypothetical protein
LLSLMVVLYTPRAPLSSPPSAVSRDLLCNGFE